MMEDAIQKLENSITVLPTYLDLLDLQRETTFAGLSGLNAEQIWQRQNINEWCIGEMLNHNYLLMAGTMSYVHFAWRFFSWYGERFCSKPYKKDIPDLYRDGKFPMWVGFLWTPRHNPKKRVPIDKLKNDLREFHRNIRNFYERKDEDVLGNISVYDPYFGWLNLVITLRLGIYQDQLHYDDVINLAKSLKG